MSGWLRQDERCHQVLVVQPLVRSASKTDRRDAHGFRPSNLVFFATAEVAKTLLRLGSKTVMSDMARSEKRPFYRFSLGRRSNVRVPAFGKTRGRSSRSRPHRALRGQFQRLTSKATDVPGTLDQVVRLIGVQLAVFVAVTRQQPVDHIGSGLYSPALGMALEYLQ